MKRLDELHARSYQSIFGAYELKRAVYGTREGQTIEWVPLDQRLQLPEIGYSYVLQDWDQAWGAEHAFSRIDETIAMILGVPSAGGIYVDRDGVLTTLVEIGESLDERTIAGFVLGPEALDGEQLVFLAGFTDGTEGIYIATIPEPATLSLLALGAAALLRRRRSR